MTARLSATMLTGLSALLMVAVACTSTTAPTPGSATATAAPATPSAVAPSAAAAAAAAAAPSGAAPSGAATSAAATSAAAPASPGQIASTAPADTSPAVPAKLESPRPAPLLEGLVNADGTPFSLADHTGSPTLVFFGYTHCPDVCPATIGEIFGVFQSAPETQAVFVSVDPERDTPEFLASWTQYFPEGFHAVTGSPGSVRRAADEYGVKYARVETSSTTGYTMSHTANVYLIDGDGQLRRTYPFGTPAAEMAADIQALQAG